METVSTIFYFIIVIGVLVLIHEFGHFIAARLSGMRTEVFSIGMGHRLFGFHKKYGFTFGPLPKMEEDEVKEGEAVEKPYSEEDEYCDYRLSMFPIGGYVKIAGMVDESFDTDYTKSEPKPWEFRSKGTLKKSFTISAGVIMNFLLAVAIFSGIIFFQGKSLFDTTTVAYVKSKSVARDIGFKPGDRIISINGEKVSNWQEIFNTMTIEDFGDSRSILIDRDGEEKLLKAEGRPIVRSMIDKESFGIYPEKIKVVFGQVLTSRPAGLAGLQEGDTSVAINGETVNSAFEFIDILQRHKNRAVYFEWKRGDKIMGDSIIPDKNGKIGVVIPEVYTGKKIHIDYNLFESIGFGFEQTVSSVELFFRNIIQIFQGNISVKESIGGPILIAKSAAAQAEMGIVSFLSFMALLSISLAIINIIPFPALDGGHLIFILVEGLIRKEVPVKVKLVFQQIGFAVLILLMVFLVYNDLVR